MAGFPSAVVWVADKCYDCQDTDIVTHYSIVEQLSDPSKGAAGIIYRRVGFSIRKRCDGDVM